VPPSPAAAGDPDAVPTPESLGVESVDPGATPAFRGSAAKKERSPRTFLVIAAVVLVAVLAGLFFLWQNSGDLFPNSTPEEGPVDAPAASQVEQARTLYERGSAGLALRRLRSLRPGHPEYPQAQELIAQWEADAPVEVPAVTGIDPAINQRRDLLLAAAAQAMDDGDPRRAVELYEGADSVAPLDDASADRLAEARSVLAPLATEIDLFEARDYQILLPRLWRLREEDPSNRLVEDLIVDTYYNMGVRELQRGDPRQALEHFQEARGLAPDDETLRRNTLLAETYSSQQRDRLYEIYVKYLPFR
jgi:tetratricopeptide (TPR) repeat protein